MGKKFAEMIEAVLGACDALGEGENLSYVRRPPDMEQASGITGELQSLPAAKPERQAERTFGQPRQGATLVGGGVGEKTRQRARDERLIERLQIEALTARTDCGKQPAGRMADQQKDAAWRRLFENLQKRVRGVVVHLIGRIDDRHAPAARPRGQPEERRKPPWLADVDHGLVLCLVVSVPLS